MNLICIYLTFCYLLEPSVWAAVLLIIAWSMLIVCTALLFAVARSVAHFNGFAVWIAEYASWIMQSAAFASCGI